MITNIKSFADAVAETIRVQAENYFPSNFKVDRVEVNEVVKGNDTKLVGIIIGKENSNVAPNIYLEKYYDRYLEGTDMDTLIDEICAVCVQNDVPNLSADDLTKLDKVKDKICIRLINAEKNTEYLANKPHKLIEDLAIMYCILVFENEGGRGSAPITDGLLDNYGITLDELHEIAMANLEKQDVSFKSMFETLKEMGMPEYLLPPQDEDEMYVLTNERKLNGASMILNKKAMLNIRESLGRDFIIIPSSIHEVIIIPVSKETMDMKKLAELIQGVNAGMQSDEVLSDHAYLYTKADGITSIR